jgi:hypothetical protein
MVGIVPLDWGELNLGNRSRRTYNYVMKSNQDRSWLFNGSVENETRLKPLCQQVEAQFHLPARRLCRYFARLDNGPLVQRFGKTFRGLHIPFSDREELSNDFSKEIFDCFFLPFDDTPAQAVQAFDNMIYIRNSTCDDTTGLVTTYAHELQHFVQHGTMPRVMRVNMLLQQNLKRLEPSAITTDVPIEKEANIVSKRVAEVVCGVESVRAFAEKQINLMEQPDVQDERTRWIFFRDMPSSIEYDYLADTLRLVEKYKTVLDFGIDVNQPEWWVEP